MTKTLRYFVTLQGLNVAFVEFLVVNDGSEINFHCAPGSYITALLKMHLNVLSLRLKNNILECCQIKL